jgi:hypothetical protein
VLHHLLAPHRGVRLRVRHALQVDQDPLLLQQEDILPAPIRADIHPEANGAVHRLARFLRKPCAAGIRKTRLRAPFPPSAR